MKLTDVILVRGVQTGYPGYPYCFSGLDTGPLEVIRWEANGTVVIKQHGHHYYSGMGRPQRYAPAVMAVYRVTDDAPPFSDRAHLKQLSEWLLRPVKGRRGPLQALTGA